MNDDIEILDIFDNKPKEEVKKKIVEKKEIKEEVPMKKKKKKVKTKALQVLFCSISALFILGCIIFYGARFIKYYRIYNPKIDSSNGSVLLAQDIIGNSEIVYEGSGLYSSSGNYIYKGDADNNYLKFNNMVWRIIRVNNDNSMEIILDDYINLLPWNKEVTSFKESDIYDYLNNKFIKSLNTEMLSKNNYCEDKVSSLTDITCNDKNSDVYVKLLDITNFLNSIKDKKSYLVESDEIMWLSDYNDDKVWHTNGINVSQSLSNYFYEIKPVVKLKNTVTYTSGDGTQNNPYIVDSSNKLTVGSVVELGKDKWYVYEIDNNVKLMKVDLLDTKKIFDKKTFNYDESSLKEYLNTTYLDSLSYKDKLVNNDWYIGEYKDSIKDIEAKKSNTKVGIPNISDIHFNSEINGYFTSTMNNDSIWTYENPLRPSRITSERSIRPCIAISKDYADKLKYSNGVYKED